MIIISQKGVLLTIHQKVLTIQNNFINLNDKYNVIITTLQIFDKIFFIYIKNQNTIPKNSNKVNVE